MDALNKREMLNEIMEVYGGVFNPFEEDFNILKKHFRISMNCFISFPCRSRIGGDIPFRIGERSSSISTHCDFHRSFICILYGHAVHHFRQTAQCPSTFEVRHYF